MGAWGEVKLVDEDAGKMREREKKEDGRWRQGGRERRKKKGLKY